MTILWPEESWKGRETKSVNNTSIVGRFHYHDFSVLLTGDIEAEVESSVVQSGRQLSSAVLKAPHHGSKTSSSALFLDVIKPELTVISLGKDNRYGHPHQEVLDRYSERNIPIMRTDEGGDIVLETFGNGFTIKRGLGFRLW